MLVVVAMTSWLLASPSLQQPSPPTDCHEWHECRQMALDACARKDYERFHDLAWRTVQTGPPRDPQLMYLVARAQSLSGRPGDALVMLERIAQMGIATDAARDDDFRTVWRERDWPQVKAIIFVLAASTPPARLVPTSPPRAKSARLPPSPSLPSLAPSPSSPSLPSSASSPPSPSLPSLAPSPLSALLPSSPALRLPPTSITPIGLAYDHVSGRFLFADRQTRKLVSVDELSRRMVDLVEAGSAGFYDITAFEIDTRRGDLWVVSATETGTDHEKATALHKLQLISGRPLATFTLPDHFEPAHFADVAVTSSGTVFVLDGEGGRIFRLSPKKHRIALACALRLDQPTSLAPIDDRTALIAYTGGLARVDLRTGRATSVTPPKTSSLVGLERIRWDKGKVIGIKRATDGTRTVVSIRVTGVTPRATAIETLDTVDAVAGSNATALSGDDVYVLTRETGRSGEDGEFVVRRARVK